MTDAKPGWPGLQTSEHSELSSSQQLGQAPLSSARLWVPFGPLALITHWVREQGMSRLETGLGKLLERRQRLHFVYLPLQTRRGAEIERVKFELLRTGSRGTVRSCSRGLTPARGILPSLRGTRGACGCSQSTATLPSLTHSLKHPRY